MIRIARPELLWWSLAIVPVGWWVWQLSRTGHWFRRWSMLCLRTAALVAVILGLAGLQHASWASASARQIWVVQAGAPLLGSALEQLQQYLAPLPSSLQPGDEAGVLVVTDDPYWLHPVERLEEVPATWPEELVSLVVDAGESGDLADAVAGAVASLGASGGRAIVLSDGSTSDVARVREQLALAKQQGVSVFPVVLPTMLESPPPRLVRVEAPEQVSAGSDVSLGVVMEHRGETPVNAELVLTDAGAEIGRWSVPLAPGYSVRHVVASTTEPGIRSLRIALVVNGQEQSHAARMINVTGPPRVLYVAPGDVLKSSVVLALDRAGFQVDQRTPEQLSGQLTDWLPYDVVMLAGVDLTRVEAYTGNILSTWVQDLGRGLVVVGGADGWGGAAATETRIADLLPVELISSPFETERQRRLSLMLLIDRSGSMEGARLRSAKQAAVELVKQLAPDDLLGITAFDARPITVLELQPVGSAKSAIVDRLVTLRAGGGTNIFPALVQAYESLVQSGAKVNHVILLSDGRTQFMSERFYMQLMRAYREAHISVSTVAIGFWNVEDAMLREVAEATGGKFYHLSNARALPELVVRDAERVSSNIEFSEGSFLPRIVEPSPILEGMTEGDLPPLGGYMTTRARPAAHVPVVVGSYSEEEPILAHWRAGLGRVVVYTPDAEPRWSAGWVRWRQYGTFWQQLVHWARGERGEGDWRVTGGRDEHGAFIDVEVSARPADGDSIVVRPLVNGQLDEPLDLQRVGPATYRAVWPGSSGVASLLVQHFRAGELAAESTVAAWIPSVVTVRSTSDRFEAQPALRLEDRLRLLEELARVTGGRVNPTPEQLVAETGQVRQWHDLYPWLALLALGCLILEIAIRRGVI